LQIRFIDVGLETGRYHFFEIDARYLGQIASNNVGGQYYRASLITFKLKFASQPIFKRSNIGRYIGRSSIDIFCSIFFI